MSVLVQVAVTGLGAGGVYGLVAVAHALVFRLTGTIHFALGDLIGLAVFATLAVAVGSGPVTQTNVAPARFALAIRAVLESFFPRQGYVFPDPFPFRRIGRGGVVDVAGASFQVRTLYVAALAVALAALVGVPIARYVALAFALAGGVAALAAVAAAPGAPVSPGTGTLLGLEGLVAALAVRFASPWLAFAAGEALGLLEAAIANVHLGSLELGPAYSRVLPIALVLVALALR